MKRLIFIMDLMCLSVYGYGFKGLCKVSFCH